jgi:phosphoglucomutase
MTIRTVATTAYPDQKPGTSGLRKKVPVFRQPNYVENFVQAVFDVVGEARQGATLVLGGDGRFLNREVVQVALRMAAANGFGRVLVGRAGCSPRPAASNLIRINRAVGGVILSASHNPGGPEGDFGIKFNVSHGGPAPESFTEAVYRRAAAITEYRTIEAPGPRPRPGRGDGAGRHARHRARPVADYAAMMEQAGDFDRISAMFRRGFRMRFDAMSAVTGPYAKAILEGRLGAPAGTVVNAEPLPDFGGHHPDPNPVHAADLMALMHGSEAPISARRRTATATAT